jgi:iron complex transport system substrate-binding protein
MIKLRLGLTWLAIALVVSAGTAFSTQAQDRDMIQVGVVVQVANELPQTFCVALPADEANGLDALAATGLDIMADSSSMGTTVCRIDDEGCTPPGENCFCQCMGGDACVYWSYFHLTADNMWQYSIMGAYAHEVTQGSVEGWWWRDRSQTDAVFPVITFDEICGTEAAFPRTVTDGLGREIVIESPPQRIASVTLASDEILLALVGPERLYGVTFFATDSAISNIADQLDGIARTDLIGNPELLISLDADLVVLTTFNNPAALDQLLDADVPLLVLDGFKTVDDIRSNIRLLGQATGAETRAEKMIAELEAALAAVQTAVAGYDAPRVLYYEPGGITYGPGSTVDAVITMAGGINVISEAGLGSYPLVNAEFVLAADPDVILLGGWFAGENNPIEWFLNDPVFGSLRAAQEGRVYSINDAHLTTVSQYIVVGVEEVARLLYPEAFGEE